MGEGSGLTGLGSAPQAGGPAVSPEVRDPENDTSQPGAGSPRIHGELLKLGIEVSERTVSRLMPRRRQPPSQPWRAFLNNCLQDLVSIDFFTALGTFRVLFVLVVLAHHCQRLVRFNLTGRPTVLWAAQQLSRCRILRKLFDHLPLAHWPDRGIGLDGQVPDDQSGHESAATQLNVALNWPERTRQARLACPSFTLG